MYAVRFLFVLLALSAAAYAESSAREVAPNRWVDVPRIVAFGDVHGAYAQLVTALQAAEVVDDQLNWVGGDTHLVSLGDLLDRGADSRQAIDLMIKLQTQALAAGGRVHVVIGNHELMNLTGDLRYVAAGEFAAFSEEETNDLRETAFAEFLNGIAEADATEPVDAELARADFDARFKPGYFAHRAGFSSTGSYGAWLLQQPLMVVLNENVFVHGGLPPVTQRLSLEEINATFAGDLAEILDLAEQLAEAGWVDPNEDLLGQDNAVVDAAERAGDDADPALVAAANRFATLTRGELFGAESPNWYRGTALCHQTLEQPVVEGALKNLGARRVVVGHSPTSNSRVQQRLDGRAMLADTGMLTSYYGGQPAPVILPGPNYSDTDLEILYPQREESAKAADYLHPLQMYGLPPDALEELLATAPLSPLQPHATVPGRFATTLEIQNQSVDVVFEAGSRQVNNQKVAAYRLSRLLRLDLVPVTIARTVEGKSGVLILLPNEHISETARNAGRLGRSNWCGMGNDYQLMYAFDALIQNERRTTDSMIYNQENWQLYLTGHEVSFGSGTGVPKYLANVKKVLPGSLPATLSALTEEQLHNEFDEQLSKRQIRSLLKRRDRLLNTWNDGESQ